MGLGDPLRTASQSCPVSWEGADSCFFFFFSLLETEPLWKGRAALEAAEFGAGKMGWEGGRLIRAVVVEKLPGGRLS